MASIKSSRRWYGWSTDRTVSGLAWLCVLEREVGAWFGVSWTAEPCPGMTTSASSGRSSS